MTIVGASRETGSLEDDVQVELEDPQNSQNDVIISSSTEPQTSTCGHSSQPCSECSIASASAAADQNKEAEEPLLPKGNGSGTSSPDMMPREAEIDDEDDGVPYDRGWAWMVVLGQFANFVLIAGFFKSGGLIFVELLKTFQASATHTAMLFAFRAGVFSFSGFYVMNVLLGQFGTRKLGLVGAILMSLSAILSSLADDLMLLICVHSILLGVGTTMLMSPGEVLVGKYFKKRRSLALGLVKCGVSMGNVVIPPLLTYLLSEYGLRGTLLLYGGVCLHSLPATLLHRPLSYFKQHHRPAACTPQTCDTGPGAQQSATNDHTQEENPHKNGDCGTLRDSVLKSEHFQQILKAMHSSNSAEDTHKGTDHSDLVMSVSQEMVPEIVISEECDVLMLAKSQPEFGVLSTSLPLPRKRTLSEIPECVTRRKRLAAQSRPDLLQTVSQSSVVRYLSMASLDGSLSTVVPPESIWDGKHTKHHISKAEHHHHPQNAVGICDRICRSVRQCPQNFILALDFSLFREPLFFLLMGFICFHPFINITLDYLPAVAIEKGIPESRCALLLSVIGGLDFVCRLTTGFIASMTAVRASTLIAISFLTVGIVMHFVGYLSTFPHFVILAVLQGLFGGVANTLYAVLVIEFLGLENMSKGLGFCLLVSGASQAIVYPFLGYIRDVTGSYAMTYHVIGTGILVAAIIVGMERPVRRCLEKRQQRRQQQQQLENGVP